VCLLDENCKDCYFINNLEQEVESIKDKVDGMETRIGKLERSNDVFIEKFNTIYSVLTDIKGSINKVAWLIITAVVVAVLSKVIM
jgi:alanine dehydrogenase